MNYLDTIKFQYYPNNIKIVKPLGELTLGEFLKSIKHPKPHVMQLFNDIEEASRIGDLKKKAELKSGLYYTTPAIYSDGRGRSYENIVSFNGICVVDVDGLEPDYAREFQKYLFHTYPFFVATYLSPSRKGVKGLVRIPVVETVEEFKQYYYGLLSLLEDYKGVDTCQKNSALAHYWTHDSEMLYRLNATVFNRKGIQLDEFKITAEEFEPLENIEQEDIDGIKLMIKRMLDRIDVEQTAHLSIRGLGLLVGGWSAYGYFNYDEIRDYVLDLMDDVKYLHKGMNGYRKTFVQMMSLGSKSALKYSNDKG